MNEEPPKVDTRRVLSVVPSLTKQRAHDLAEAMRILEHADATGDLAELDAVADLLQAAKRRIQASASRPPASVASVLSSWRTEGPLVHAPTGIATLDKLTGGGPVYGSRWYLIGAPDAGKTALLVQLLDAFLARGDVAGLLAVDEDSTDVVTRFLQRRRFRREECEARTTEDLDLMESLSKDLDGLRLYDASWTIEAAATDLASFAAARGARAVFGLDSIQTVRCEAETRAGSIREAVTARVMALRDVATRFRLVTLATGEMNRAAYRTVQAAEEANDLASAKESGAIEYSARVLLALRSVKDEPDLVELRVAKNKHGPRDEKIGLRIDRRMQVLLEAQLPAETDAQEERREAKNARAKSQTVTDAAALVRVLLAMPGVVSREILGAMKAELGEIGAGRRDAAIAKLGAACRKVQGKRTAEHHFLVGAELPDDVLAALPSNIRPVATRATVSPEALCAALK